MEVGRGMEKAEQAGEDERLEAKIYNSWRLVFPWLTLGPDGLGCKLCQALTKGDRHHFRGNKAIAEGRWKQNPKFSFSSQAFSGHCAGPMHSSAKKKSCKVKPFSQGSRQATENGAASHGAQSLHGGSGGSGEPGNGDAAAISEKSSAPAATETAPESSQAVQVKVEQDHESSKPVDTSLRQQWVNTVGLAHLTLARYNGFPDWEAHMKFNADRNDTYLDDHMSDTIWKEIVEALVESIETSLLDAIKKSPIFGMSFDTKKRDLAVVIHFLDIRDAENFQFVSVPLARVKISGENADGLEESIRQLLTDKGIDISRLAAVGSEGCGTTGLLS